MLCEIKSLMSLLYLKTFICFIIIMYKGASQEVQRINIWDIKTLIDVLSTGNSIL